MNNVQLPTVTEREALTLRRLLQSAARRLDEQEFQASKLKRSESEVQTALRNVARAFMAEFQSKLTDLGVAS